MADQTERPPVEASNGAGDASPGPGPHADGSRRAKIAAGIGGAAVVAAGVAVGVTEFVRNQQAIPRGSIRVNGITHRVQSAPDTPLLYVLRDELGLKGPKFGCGLGECGACSVLVGDKETRSCITNWTSLTEEVTTLEGLAARWAKQKSLSAAQAAKTLHPVQQAWIDQQVPQCGYCQNGMIIMAVDLLTRTPSPSEAQIRNAFTNTPPSPHLCRCGTYMSIIAAVQRASKTMA
ncbi:MAG TPA: (2Fe-2S)-binding protein [Candidatus Dormibacteraeota bacterium]|nr:(2Fe-2S)-binding protein [Candidatus Dormibacteraeota bacterium]